MPANPGRQVISVVMNEATPTRITNSGHAWFHVQSFASRMRKTRPRPISQVAPVIAPRRELVTAAIPLGPRVAREPDDERGPPEADEQERPEQVDVEVRQELLHEEDARR